MATARLTITSSRPKVPKNFEDILEVLGGFGLFQLMTLVLLLVLEIPAAFIAFSPVFVGNLLALI